MSGVDELAARLRQAVQGCTLHLHGPVQAWWAVEQAVARGEVDRADVARAAVGASERRLATLRGQGVSDSDPRVRKEIVTARFMARLFGESESEGAADSASERTGEAAAAGDVSRARPSTRT